MNYINELKMANNANEKYMYSQGKLNTETKGNKGNEFKELLDIFMNEFKGNNDVSLGKLKGGNYGNSN